VGERLINIEADIVGGTDMVEFLGFTIGRKKPSQEVFGGSAGDRYGSFDDSERKMDRLARFEAAVKKRKSHDETYAKSALSDKYQRIAAYLLENMFGKEPIIFGGCTSWQNLIKETSFKIWSSNSETQKEIERLMKDTNFIELWLGYNPLHLTIFGRYFTEYLWSKDDPTSIIGFNPLNPVYMDYLRDKSTNAVIFDDWGLEKAFVQDLQDATTPEQYSRSECFHANLFQANRGQLGIGFIEPIYIDTELKENIEQARANEAYARANRIPMVEYGSELVKPTAELKSRAEKLAQDLVDPETEWVAFSGQEMKIHWLEPPKVEAEMLEQLLYVTKLQAAVLRIPVNVLMRATVDDSPKIDDLLDFFEYDFKAFQEALKIKEAVIEIIKAENEKRDANKIPYNDITIEFGKLSQKSIKEFIMRIMRMGKAGLLNPAEPDVKKWIKSGLGIPEEGKATPPSTDAKGVVK
jgi:hypothetical protein